MYFVTGATGLLGGHLLLSLVRTNEDVRALSRPTAELKNLRHVFRFMDPAGDDLFARIKWVSGDVTDVESLLHGLEGCDKVFHCAAVVSYHKKERKSMYKINVEGTTNVLNAALHHNISRFCHVSSIASFGRLYDGQLLNETSQWTDAKLHTHYGITKHLSELEVWRAIQEGLPAVIVNPGFIIGPSTSARSSTSIFRKIDSGLPFYPPGGTGMVSVTDVVTIMRNLIESDINAERFIVVSENLTFRELFVLVADRLNKKIPTIEAPLWMLNFLRYADLIRETITGKSAIVTKESLKNASLTFSYDNSKIKKILDYEFQPIKDIVTETVRYYQAEKKEFAQKN